MRYWQEQASAAAAEEEQIEKLVKQKVAAWIAGLKKRYKFPDRKLRREELEKVKETLEKERLRIERLLSKDNFYLQRKINPFYKALKKEIVIRLPGIPRAQRNKAAETVALGTIRALQNILRTLTEANFGQALEAIFPEALQEDDNTKMRSEKFKEELPKIVENLEPYFEDSIKPLAQITQQLNEKIFGEAETVSAINLPLEVLFEEIRDQLKPEPGRTIEQEWEAFKEWLYTSGYPTQMIIRLIKSDPTVFTGSAKTIIKTIKESILPGLTTRRQFFNIFAMGLKGLMVTEWSAAVHGWFEYVGKEKFEEDYGPWEKWREIPYEVAMDIKKRLRDELTLVETGEKTVSFKEREKLLTYTRLFEYIEAFKEFQEEHPRLAGAFQRFGWLYSWPVRHPHTMLIYQLRKAGPYAPRLLLEFYTKWLLQTALRHAVVKATEKYWWGWERKYVPLIGYKTVWKPAEWVKTKVKEKLSRLGKAVLKKLGLEKVALKIAGLLSGWGTAISLMWKEIKKAAKALVLGFIAVLITLGKTVATGFAIGAGLGIGVGGFLGFKAGAALGAKLGGTIGGVIGGPIGAIAGGIIGGIVGAILGTIGGYLWVTKVLPWWHSLTAPITAPAAAEAVGGAGALTVIELTPNAIIAGATPVVIGALAVGTIIFTSSAFVIPVEEKVYGSRYIQIQKGFDINGERQTTTIFEYDDIKGKNLNYAIKVTILEKTLTNVVINDKLEIIGEEVIELHNETWDKNNTPELAEMKPGDSWETSYTIVPDDQFRDSYISNTVTVTSDEGETQTLTLTLTVGQPPVPESVFLIRKIVDILRTCPGLPKEGGYARVNRSTWPTAEKCLEEAGIPNYVIDVFDRCTAAYYQPKGELQCVCFLVAATLGDFPGKAAARDYCSEPTSGYTFMTDWENIQEGDIIASDKSITGHVAMVSLPPVKNERGQLLHIEVAEAIGTNGVVQYRDVDVSVLKTRYCGYLRKK